MRQRYRMIGNQKGVTLFELLAAATLATICFLVVMSLWISSENNMSGTMEQNNVQQDATIVQKGAESAFENTLNHSSDTSQQFQLHVYSGKVALIYNSSASPEILSNGDTLYVKGSNGISGESDGTGGYYFPSKNTFFTSSTSNAVICLTAESGTNNSDSFSFSINLTNHLNED